MVLFRHRILPVFFYGLFQCSATFSQNLVPNPSFEEHSACPWVVAQLELAVPWQSPNHTTPDYLNACAADPSVGVPLNTFGYQLAHTGVAYGGAQFKDEHFSNREYLMAPLLEPLIAGVKYEVSFWVSLAEEYCGTTEFAAYFSETPPGPPGLFDVIEVEPQFKSTIGFVSDTAIWVLISGCFIPAGGELYITIGNFTGEYDTPIDSNCTVDGSSYYFIDDVSVINGGQPDSYYFDLGDPVFSCEPIVIDPDLSNVNYYWEDGTNNSTLLVTESGISTLTATSGCTLGVDSIDVSINGVEDVDIGPEEITICFGETYDIVLDSDWSEYLWQDGSTDAEYSISTAGFYQVTMNDGCAISFDEILVNIVYEPGPDFLGDDTYICPDNQIEYDFDASTSDFIWQDNSTSAYYSITEPGSYALTISNACGVFSDVIEILAVQPPAISLGPDSIYLCSGDSVFLEFDPEMGYFDWQDNSHHNTYLITSPGIYSLSVTNDCGVDYDQTEVFLMDAPLFNLGEDIDPCIGDTLLLDGDGVQGIYLWQDSTFSNEYLVTHSGTYSLTIANTCGIGSDTIVVDYTSTINSPGLGPDINLCPGEQYILYAGVSDGDYIWQDSSTADSLLIIAPGMYYLQISNACSTFSDTIVVSYNNVPPLIDLPQQISLCQDQSITLDAGIGGVTYLWNDNSQNPQLLVNAPGTYSLTVSNACGADQDTVIILDGGPSPAVSLGNDFQLCPGDHVLVSPLFSNVDTWLWHDGSVLPSYDVYSAGWITVAVGNACGMTFDTLLVEILPATPPVYLGPDTALCSWQSFTLSIQTPGVTVLWSDGSTGLDFIVSQPGNVTASISNPCGTSYDTLVVDALPDIPTLNLGPDQSLCPGEIIVVSPGIPDVNYVWQDGSLNNSYQSTQQESIILTISNDCGASTDTLEIIESTLGPQVNLGPDIQECEGAIVILPSGISGVGYLWQDGSTHSSFTTIQSGVFILQVSNNCGTDADTIAVDISGVQPTPVLGPDTVVCDGNTLELVSNADAITSVLWQDSSSLSSFTVSSPGTFTLTEFNRCGIATDTIIVSYLETPVPFTLGPDTTLCPGESITLTAPSTTFDLLWQDGSMQATINANQPITYSLQMSNDCGFVSDDLVLFYDTHVPVVDFGHDLSWCEGDVFTLDASQPFLADYLWSNGNTTSSIEISSPGVYSVEVLTDCITFSQEVDIIPGSDCQKPEMHTGLYIPNVFSPNGDGINDRFFISGDASQIESIHTFRIFDRWGEVLYEALSISPNDESKGWDGYYQNQGLNPGVFTYVAEVEYVDGVVEVVTGDFTLVK